MSAAPLLAYDTTTTAVEGKKGRHVKLEVKMLRELLFKWQVGVSV